MTVTMNFSLNEELETFINQQIEQGRYQNRSEYMRALVRQDQERVAQERLESLLIEGLDSGSIEMTPEVSKEFDALMASRISEARRKK